MKSGNEQLKDWMHRRRFMQKEAAAYLSENGRIAGWDETYVSRLLSGVRTPGLDNAIHIERMTGIPVEAWLSSELGNDDEAVAVSGSKRKLHK